MKKLALAPVVALAITGLAASPVIAAPSSQSQEAPGSLQKAQSPAQVNADEGAIAVSTDSLSLEEFASTGVSIAGAKLTAEAEYKLVVSPADGQNVKTYTEDLTTDADGTFATAVSSEGAVDEVFVGKYTVTVTSVDDESESYSTSFEVTGGDDETEEPTTPAVDPKVTLATDTISVAEISTDGLKFSGEGFTPGGTVTISGGQLPNQAKAQSGTQADEPLKADENGKITGTLVAPESVKPGKYAVVFTDDETGEATDPHQFTITEDATDDPTEDPTTPAAEAKLTVSPESVTPQDFVNEKKGVRLAVENCEPGEDVRFLVNPEGDTNVTAFDRTVQADDEGKADVTVYGTSESNPNAYTGDYTVTVTCGDDKLTGKFSVEADPNAGGGDGGDDEGGNGGGNGGGDLPRTGMELGGLAAGAALLLVGGAVVTMTKRRRKAALSPSDI